MDKKLTVRGENSSFDGVECTFLYAFPAVYKHAYSVEKGECKWKKERKKCFIRVWTSKMH